MDSLPPSGGQGSPGRSAPFHAPGLLSAVSGVSQVPMGGIMALSAFRGDASAVREAKLKQKASLPWNSEGNFKS